MKNELMVINKETMKDKIFTIRGQKVMLDFHLAEIYGYTTKAFNQQVQRNIEKFDENFRFQLNLEEIIELSRSQFVTSIQTKGIKGGRAYLPYAFTEQGIYMLMTVLRGELATRQSKMIIRLFKEMKDYLVNNSYVSYDEFTRYSLNTSDDIKKIETKIDKDLVSKKEFYDVIDELTDKKIPKEYLLLNGEKVEGDMAYKEIYYLALKSIYIIDNYVSLKTLVLLKNIKKDVEVVIFTDNKNNGLHKLEFDDFIKEYPINIKFKTLNGLFHDRYIIIDYQTNNEIMYHSGPSSKDIGNKVGFITTISEIYAYYSLINEVLKNDDLILK